MSHMTLSRCIETSLKQYRIAHAVQHQVSRYSVFGDAVLRQIVSAKPTSLTELKGVRGMDTTRYDRFGKDIVTLVRSCVLNSTGAHFSSCLNQHRDSQRKRAAASAASPASIDQDFRRQPYASIAEHFRRLAAAASLEQRRKRPRTAASAPPAVSLSLLPPAERHRAVLSVDPPAQDQVYILELAQGKVYVGKSSNVGRRVGQHAQGLGAAWTKAHPPTGRMLPRLGNVHGGGDAAERDETLRYMHLRGVDGVRGWRYVRVSMTQAELADAEANIRELFDLCRRCGRASHFASKCRATVDRNGSFISAR